MHVLAKIELDRWLRIVLPIFMLTVFIMTATGSIVNYLDHHSWKMGDWLINYSGGWIRRGFLGEIFLNLSKLTHINPGIYAASAHIVFYFVYFLFSFLLLRKQKNIVPFALLIFSPFIFTFQLNDFQGGYRKEIIYFAVLSFIAWTRVSLNPQKFERVFILTLLIYPFAVLSHEMLFLFMPYIVLVYTFDKKITVRLIGFIFLLVMPSFLAFIFSVQYQGSIEHTIAIQQSLADTYYNTSQSGAIFALQYDTGYWIERMNRLVTQRGYIYTHIIVIGLSLVAFMPIRPQLKIVLAKWHGKALVISCFVATLFIAMVAIDWGRLIYINLVSLFILSLLTAKGHPATFNRPHHKKPSIFAIIPFFIWSLFWHIPHCCKQPISIKRFSDLNSHSLIKPVYRLHKKLKQY
ncbi:hypothetical protein [Candidatus Albibeggiatoa sp. nov. NOAA]|uniref:hypothetical protein n=1 Tax=Candidatus Albibeggiatoa sp. nov. NOAA TaxID=3162724 RepID=UPI0032FE9BCA|nr:hypothetical protein [Thiotrichaceae bacterium]